MKSRSRPTAWGQLYLDCWNRGSPLALLAVFAPDCRYEDLGAGLSFDGHPGIRRRLERIRTAWPDAHFSCLSGFTNFDRYTVEWVMTATADRQPFVSRGVSVGLLDGRGRIAHNRDYHESPPPVPPGEAPAGYPQPAAGRSGEGHLFVRELLERRLGIHLFM